MAIVTVGEVLDRGREYEERLAAMYAKVRDLSPDNGVRLLTYYLARQRRHQEMALAGIDRQTLRQVRSVELKFDVPFDPDAEFNLPDIVPETVRGDELIKIAVRHDDTLVGLYRAILEQPVKADARAVLEALIRVEERDLVMLKKMLAMHYF